MPKKFLFLISFVLVLSLVCTGYGADANRPKPGLTWYLPPTAMGPYAITMGVTITADGETPPVRYYFECTNDATKSSGWIRCTDTPGTPAEPNGPEPATYTATGLNPSTVYSFRVRARDSYEPNTASNYTSWIGPNSVSTDAATTPPVIRVDLNNAQNNDEPNTQVGFAPFILGWTGREANDINGNASGVIVDIRTAGMTQALRGDPCGQWTGIGSPKDPCLYKPRAGERLYRDFICGTVGNGVDITLWGLGAEQDCNLTLWAYDMRSTGEVNRVAMWYANGTYMFDTNFTGGSETQPGYAGGVDPAGWSTTQDLYKHAYHKKVTADKFGRIVLTSERGPGSPEPFAFVNALMVEANSLTTYAPTKYAHRPVPFNGTEGVPASTLLRWRNGAGVSCHNFFLDTDFDDVNEGDTGNVLVYEECIGANENLGFDPTAGSLYLDTTYYWRVDEDDSSNIYPGDVWSFTTGPNSVVDDFKTYGIDIPLNDTWKDYWTQSSPTTRALVYDVVEPNHGGQPAMKYWYRNHLSPYYAEARAEIGTGYGKLNINNDWAGMGAKSMTVWFYGTATNDANEQMYVKLVDGAGVVGKVNCPNNAQIREELWHEWNIVLQTFVDNAPTLNLGNVSKIYIGFGDGAPAGANDGIDDIVYFDDIQIYATRCALAERSSDFAQLDFAPAAAVSGDCVIDYQEIDAIADYWLARDTVASTQNPGDTNLVVYYKMNEADGNNVYSRPDLDSPDACDTRMTGTFYNFVAQSDLGTSWAAEGAPGIGGGCSVYFSGTEGARVNCGITYGDTALGIGPRDTNAITLSVWIKWLGPRYWDQYLLSKGQGVLGKRGGWSDDTVIWTLWTSGAPDGRWGFGNYPNAHPDRPDVGSPNNSLNPFIGQWIHLAATYPNPPTGTDPNSRARLYLNGGQISSGPYTFAYGYDPNIFLSIGNTMDQNAWPMSPESFYGYIDEVRIYNRVLDPNEVAYLADPTPDDGLLWIPIPSGAEVYPPDPENSQGSNVINFKDLAVIADVDRWLTEEMFPR